MLEELESRVKKMMDISEEDYYSSLELYITDPLKHVARKQEDSIALGFDHLAFIMNGSNKLLDDLNTESEEDDTYELKLLRMVDNINDTMTQILMRMENFLDTRFAGKPEEEDEDNDLGSLFGLIAGALMSSALFRKLKNAIDLGIVKPIKALFGFIKDWILEPSVNILKRGFDKIKSASFKAFDSVVDFIKSKMGKRSIKRWSKRIDNITKFVTSGWDRIIGAVEMPLNKMEKVFSFIVKGLKSAVGVAKKVFEPIIKLVSNLIKPAKSMAKLFGKLLLPLNILIGVIDFVTGFLNADKLLDIDKEKVTWKEKLIAGIGSFLHGFVFGLIDGIAWILTLGKVSDLTASFGLDKKTVVKAIKKSIDGFVNGIKFIVNETVKLLSFDFSSVGKLWDWGEEQFSSSLSWLEKLPEAIKNFTEPVSKFVEALLNFDFKSMIPDSIKNSGIGKKIFGWFNNDSSEQKKPEQVSQPVLNQGAKADDSQAKNQMTVQPKNFSDNTIALSKAKLDESSKAPVVNVQPAPVIMPSKTDNKPQTRTTLRIDDEGTQAINRGKLD